jgi:hypothetical protein
MQNVAKEQMMRCKRTNRTVAENMELLEERCCSKKADLLNF